MQWTTSCVHHNFRPGLFPAFLEPLSRFSGDIHNYVYLPWTMVVLSSSGPACRRRTISVGTAGIACNSLGVWLLQNCISILKHVHHLSRHAIVPKTCICNIRNYVCFILDFVVNGSSATCECNMSFLYLETWQHGRNVAS